MPNSKINQKTQNFKFWLVVFIFYFLLLPLFCYAAPCYGTRMPDKHKFSMGLQSHAVLKRYLEDDLGKLKSMQYFLLLSWGLYDWLSIDLKGGGGDIQHYSAQGDKINYAINFAGGYGFRLKFYDRKNVKMVFGFQHISVHPRSTDRLEVKNKAVLDDWQVSCLASYDFKNFTPYLGARWSRLDYIHWQDQDRKRVMSDLAKSTGLILGLDIPIGEKIWLNLEGNLFDSQAWALSLNYNF